MPSKAALYNQRQHNTSKWGLPELDFLVGYLLGSLEFFSEKSNHNTSEGIVFLVRWFQLDQPSLIADGMLGPKTIAVIHSKMGVEKASRESPAQPPFTMCWPVPKLPDGRPPVVSSGHWLVNKYRTPTQSYEGHQGVDIMYHQNGYSQDVLATFEARYKTTNHFIHPCTKALACADGTVQSAYQSKGGLNVKIVHSGGYLSVYRHLKSYSVRAGDKVHRGQPIGVVGGVPPNGVVHLHFELYGPDKHEYYADRNAFREGGIAKARSEGHSLNPKPLLETAEKLAWRA